ncbi:hypothetical protein DFJ73DRAFT_822790 [Zopfochytrium polystomum]|nr:hypothetical protein DFJ73DRAFT_822790 [Zopfochytrium polystomum]
MTRSELVHSLANRILHSTFYQWFYLVMMGLSIVCLILSTIQMCPTGFFYFLEAVVNLIMIFEVLIRFYALGQVFWKSLWNVLDVILVVFCVFTLFWLLFGTCTTERSWETEADTLLLVVRNGIQFSRLAVMLGKNRGGRPLLPTAIRPGGSGGAAGASSRIDLSTADPNVVVVGGMLGDESDPFLSPMVRNTGFVNFEGEDDDFI